MNNDRIQYLLHLYLDDSCTAAELKELKSWLMDPEHEAYFNKFLDEVWQEMDQNNLSDVSKEKADFLFKRITTQPQKNKNTFRLWSAAAAVLVISMAAVLFFYARSPRENAGLFAGNHQQRSSVSENDKAVLTLADGRVINLNTEKKGVHVSGDQLAYTDGSVILSSLKGGAEDSALTDAGDQTEEQYAILSIPKGRHYEIVLADGTKVWLNAGSKLKYPARFSNKCRMVELEGEGYFDVTRSKDKPFIVKSKGQEVTVLGTEFNIAAYEDDEVIRTTLIQGSVKVIRKDGNRNIKALILKPGQQAAVDQDGQDIDLSDVDVNEVTDWKEGLFLFNNEPVKNIMKRLSRWYNIEVIYRGNVDHVRFAGSYARSKNLKNLLKNMEQTGKVTFRIENDSKGKERRVIVTNSY